MGQIDAARCAGIVTALNAQSASAVVEAMSTLDFSISSCRVTRITSL
jgi:hypothetical protein